jgi:hypothetical protein
MLSIHNLRYAKQHEFKLISPPAEGINLLWKLHLTPGYVRTSRPGVKMRVKIASVGEPVLRNAARVLRPEEIGTVRIRELIEHMRETLTDAPGVGLAAPQVGESLQRAIIEDKAQYHATLTRSGVGGT